MKKPKNFVERSQIMAANLDGIGPFDPATDYLGPEKVRDAVVRFRRKLPQLLEKGANLYLLGDMSSGVHELADSIAMAALQWRMCTYSTTWTNLYGLFRRSWRSGEEEGVTFQEVCAVSVLIMHKVPGSEKYAVDPLVLETFENVLLQRRGSNKITVMTNYPYKIACEDLLNYTIASIIKTKFKTIQCPSSEHTRVRQDREHESCVG